MAIMYTRKANGKEIRMGYYKDNNEYVVYVNNRLYGVAYNVKDAYALYNEVI